MKKLILLTLIVVAFIGCSKDEPEIIEEEVENILSGTLWQSYMPIFENHYMVKKYIAFKESGICEFTDSVSVPVSKKNYYYNPLNGEPFNGLYYVDIFHDAAKTDKYETLTVQKNLDRLSYYWIMGDLAAVIQYKRIN